MGLIIGKKIDMLMKGYPTVSDKYNVAGGTLTGDDAVKFGELVKFSDTKGYYEAITETVTLADIAGFVVATNVKLVDSWGIDASNEPLTLPGEAFNLLVSGFIAIELDSGATEAKILPNTSVAVILASGKLTTNDKIAGSTIVALPNVVFTGTYEKHGTTILAEILVK